MTIEEIWARCAALEERLRWKVPTGQPFPRLFEMRGIARVSGADYAQAPSTELVAKVLEALLDAAEHAYDFEAQKEILELMAALPQ